MTRGERSEEVWAWYTAVYEAIQEIPRGRVTTYGHIARLLGKPERPRQVGVCLKNLPLPSSDPGRASTTYHSSNVPWQRVINNRGAISPRGPGSASRQATALRREGVQVTQRAMGEFTIDMQRYGWFPSVLPSEEGGVEEDSDESGEDEDEETAADAAAYHT